MDPDHPAPFRIGYAVSKKKQAKFITCFVAAVHRPGVEVVALDFTAVPEVEVDVLLHKLVDEMAKEGGHGLSGFAVFERA